MSYTTTVSSFQIVMISIILGSMILVLALGAIFYFIGIEPARLLEKWLAELANGDRVPEKPNVGLRYWLLPVHRELQGVEKKMEELRAGFKDIEAKLARNDFLYKYILASLIEGIVVVDEKHRVLLVNSEFMNLFQLTQSPLHQPLKDVLNDSKLDALIRGAFEKGQVEAGRITWQSGSEGGRPPAFEVSAIPVHATKDQVGAVVVLFLPPPDRTRVLQVLKKHSEKLNKLVSERTLSDQEKGSGSGGQTASALPLLKENPTGNFHSNS